MNKIENRLFTDPIFDGDFEVLEITKEDLDEGIDFDQDTVYLYGDYIYKYRGIVNSIPKAPKGSIVRFRDRIVKIDHDENNKVYYHKDRMYDPSVRANEAGNMSFDDIFARYSDKYDRGLNVMNNNKGLLLNSGDIFVPEIMIDDDPLTMIIKTIILGREVNLNVFRATHQSPPFPTLDNLRSGLIEPTRELSMPYFLGWCSVLELDWVFTLSDRPGTPSPMCGQRIITNFTDLTDIDAINEDIQSVITESNNKITLVLLAQHDNALKRLIKLALIDKRINIKDYKDKGSTPNLVNNMMSTLKGKSKMSISYFINWCEILGLVADFQVIGKDGNGKANAGLF